MFKLTSKKKKQIISDALKKIDSKVDKKELAMGVEVEMEHTGTKGKNTDAVGKDHLNVARIAVAHLHEIPDYYTRLKGMENKYEK